MRFFSASMDPIRYRPGRSWWGRVGQSRLFAWVISAGLHGAAFVTLYATAVRDEAPPRRVIIPEANLVGGGAGQASALLSPPRLELSRQPMPAPLPPSRLPLDASRQPVPGLPEVTAVLQGDVPLIAAVTLDDPTAFAIPVPQGSNGTGPTSPGAVVGWGGGGPAPGASAGPVSSFFGQAGNAYRVVYVVDVSASLWIYIEEIIREMRGSIAGLVPTQRFHIVLARPGRVEEFAPRRLVPAIGQYKQQAGQFLDTVSGTPEPGPAQPIAAMERAFAVQPELIYFLSDGDYARIQSELEQRLEQLNADHAVKITVIGFGPSPSGRALLERIARTHGGHFRAVEPQP